MGPHAINKMIGVAPLPSQKLIFGLLHSTENHYECHVLHACRQMPILAPDTAFESESQST